MARISLCNNCKKELKTKEEKYMYSNKNYCIDCYNIKQKDKEDYEKLISYINLLFETNSPSGIILKQIKDYKENYGYVYTGILYCLWYLKDIKNLKFESKYGIGIVKYEYENAKSYFIKQQQIQNSVKDVKINEKENKVIVKKTNSKKDDKCKLLINLDNLLDKDGE